MIFYLVNLLFTTYTFLLIARIVGSWFPRFSNSKLMRFVGFYTDPYLNIFRRVIPPLGMIDLSPMVAFFVLQILQTVFLMILK